jgi:hypothetical protein
MKPSTYVRAVLVLLLLALVHAATGQQITPWERKPCKEEPGPCGIVVTFNPPIEDALLVPNEVTVELGNPSKVIVSVYPLGTGIERSSYHAAATLYRLQKNEKYVRFRGEIKECSGPDIEVLVFFKNFERTPISPYGMALDCRQTGPKAAH